VKPEGEKGKAVCTVYPAIFEILTIKKLQLHEVSFMGH